MAERKESGQNIDVRLCLDNIFLILIGAYLFWQFVGSTTYSLPFPAWFNKVLFVSMVVTAALRSVFLGIRGGKDIKSPELWFSLLLLLAYGVVFLRGKHVFLLYTAVMTVGIRGIDYRRVLLVFLLTVGMGFLITIMSGLPGIITNFVYVRAQRGVRSAWGICYPTDFASIFLFILMALWVYGKGLPDWGMLFFCALSILLSGKIAYSSTSLICSLLLTAAVLYHMLEEKLRNSVSWGNCLINNMDVLLEAAFPLCSLVFFAFLYLYHRGVPAAYKVDTILSSRLRLALAAWEKYGITLFGTPFDQVGAGFSSIVPSDYNFVDSTYPLLLIRYGVMLILMLGFLWVWVTRQAVRYGDRRLAFVLGIIAFHSFSEHHFIEVHYNIFLLLPFAAFSAESVLKEENGYAKMAVSAGAGLTGTLVLYLSSPAFLSYLKTFCELQGLNGIGKRGWYVVILNLVLILLISGLYYYGRQIICSLLSGEGKIKKRENGENKAATGELRKLVLVFFFCAFALTGGFIFADREFDRELELRRETFREESKVLQLITDHADGKVYAGTLPVLYKKQFPGICYSYFYGEEMARCPGSTAILDSDTEYWCLSRSGFLYTRISDDHSVYTSDRAVIQALTDAGYSLTSYYSTVKNVKLRYEAELNRLPISNSKGIRLKGPTASMLYGPYLDLYGGRYTLTLHLAVPQKELEKEGGVCSIRVTTECAKNKLLEKEVTISDFDENGKAVVQVIFKTENVRDVEFPVITAPGRTVYVQGIEYQKTPELDIHSFYDMKMRLVREEYYDEEGKAVAQSGGFFSMEQDYDEDGNISSQRFYDSEGNLTLRTEGYAEVKWVYNAKRQIVREAFFGTNGEPVMISNRQAANEREYDNNGNVTVYRYYGTDGLPVVTLSGYAELHRRYNKERKIIYEGYFGTDGKPLMQERGYTALEQDYDKDGNIISRRFLSEGKPVLRTDGYAEVHWDYNGLHQIIRESFFDEEGKPVRLSNGAAANEREYDTAGNVIIIRYYDEEGNAAYVSGYAELHRRFDDRRQIPWEGYFGSAGEPVLIADGYASLERDFTEEGIGRIRAQRHFGLSREPVRTTDGYFEYRREYDEHGDMIREQYFDIDENPILCSGGYAVLCCSYDDKENLTEEWYLDTEGNPAVRSAGYLADYTRITFEYDDSRQLLLTHYLDADGNLVQAGSAFFHEYLQSLVKLREQGEVTIFISVRDEAMNALTPPIFQDLKDLGIKTDLKGRSHCSYYAVISPQGVQEEIDLRKKLSFNGFVDGKPFTIVSAGYLIGDISSIMIDGTEYSKNRRGMNIVVYDHTVGQVIDSIRFDTFVQEMTVMR